METRKNDQLYQRGYIYNLLGFTVTKKAVAHKSRVAYVAIITCPCIVFAGPLRLDAGPALNQHRIFVFRLSRALPSNTKPLYNIFTMLDQR